MELKKAMTIQEALGAKVVLEWTGPRIRTVAGADFAYDPEERDIGTCIVVFSFPDLKMIEVSQAVKEVEFPYVPGFLAFREGPAFFEAYRRLRFKPDLTLLDGNGIAHPRRMGLASYVGVVLDIATVGCAKSAFYPFRPPAEPRGSFSIFRNQDGDRVGFCLRTRAGIRPIFVSPGHRVDFVASKRLVLACSKFRIPEPLREAHRQATEIFRS